MLAIIAMCLYCTAPLTIIEVKKDTPRQHKYFKNLEPLQVKGDLSLKSLITYDKVPVEVVKSK